MMRCLILWVICFISFQAIAQQDSLLQRRLNEYISLNKQLNFEKLMDYIHPKLFKIVSRQQLIQVFGTVYNSEQMTISIDSLLPTQISPPYNYKDTLYKRIDYYISMSLKFRDSSILKNDTLRSQIKQQLKQPFANANIAYIEANNLLKIDSRKVMFAIKDNSKSKWMFLGYEPDQKALVQLLFPEQMLGYFKLE